VRRDFADVPRDRGWLLLRALAAEVAWAPGDATVARVLAAQLAPYERITVVAGSGLLHYGCVAHFLGLLEATCGRWDAAIARFDAAVAIEQRLGAPLWETHARVARAHALRRRDGPGDRVAGAHAAREPAALAAARGWARAAADAARVTDGDPG
jgi:hypothetical protein